MASSWRETSVIVDDTSSLRFLRDGWRSLAVSAQAQFSLIHGGVLRGPSHEGTGGR